MGKRTRPQEAMPAVAHGFDGRPPILANVRGITDPETRARATPTRNTNHSVIARLHHQRHLDDRGGDRAVGDLRLQAAEQLQGDFHLAGLSTIPSTLGLLTAGGSGQSGPGGINDVRIDAYSRVVNALRATGGAASFLLGKIVLDDMTLKQVAALMHVNDTAVLPALRVALDALCAHYGLKLEARSKIRGGNAQPIHPFHDVSHGTDEKT